MKAPLCMLFALCLVTPLWAQVADTQYTPEQLDKLAGPIALYPDPLVALILPASTVPSDISAAAQFIAGGGTPAQVDSQPWDKSVVGLAHYPEVIKWMNDNLQWTQALGAAFAMQPADVMKSIQQLRAQAKAAGTLVDTPQQRVEIDGDDIRIVPVDDNTIYPPQYDADTVYDTEDGAAGPFLTFNVGYPVGPWLGFECDWDDFGIWIGPWQSGWGYRRDWLDPRYKGNRWHADGIRGHALVRNFYKPSEEIPRPRPISGTRIEARGPAMQSRGPAVQPRTPAPAERSTPNYRGYSAPVPAPSRPAPQSPLIGGYSRGTQTREYSTRGNSSRQAPVSRAAPQRSAPARSSPPSSGGKDRR